MPNLSRTDRISFEVPLDYMVLTNKLLAMQPIKTEARDVFRCDGDPYEGVSLTNRDGAEYYIPGRAVTQLLEQIRERTPPEEIEIGEFREFVSRDSCLEFGFAALKQISEITLEKETPISDIAQSILKNIAPELLHNPVDAKELAQHVIFDVMDKLSLEELTAIADRATLVARHLRLLDRQISANLLENGLVPRIQDAIDQRQ